MEGVKLPGPDGKKMRFLRRIPSDPFTGKAEWGMRSDQDDPKSPELGRPVRVRRLQQDHGKGARWKALLRMVTDEHRPKSRRRGFTFVELMVVITIIVILISMAIPIYNRSIIRAKESVLENNLFTLRTVIDNYSTTKGKRRRVCRIWSPRATCRSCRSTPFTGNNQTWRTIMEDASQSVSQSEPGIFDVKSGSDKMGLDGTPYSEW